MTNNPNDALQASIGEEWWKSEALDVIRHARTNEPHDTWEDWRNAIIGGLLRAYNRGIDAKSVTSDALHAALREACKDAAKRLSIAVGVHLLSCNSKESFKDEQAAIIIEQELAPVVKSLHDARDQAWLTALGYSFVGPNAPMSEGTSEREYVEHSPIIETLIGAAYRACAEHRPVLLKRRDGYYEVECSCGDWQPEKTKELWSEHIRSLTPEYAARELEWGKVKAKQQAFLAVGSELNSGRRNLGRWVDSQVYALERELVALSQPALEEK